MGMRSSKSRHRGGVVTLTTEPGYKSGFKKKNPRALIIIRLELSTSKDRKMSARFHCRHLVYASQARHSIPLLPGCEVSCVCTIIGDNNGSRFLSAVTSPVE